MGPLESARNVSRGPGISAVFLIVGIIRPLHFTSCRAIRPAHAWSSPEVCYVDNIWSCIKVLYNPKGLAVLITTGLDVISLIPNHSVSPCFNSITHTRTQSFTETAIKPHCRQETVLEPLWRRICFLQSNWYTRETPTVAGNGWLQLRTPVSLNGRKRVHVIKQE